jgi:hypothetical protein
MVKDGLTKMTLMLEKAFWPLFKKKRYSQKLTQTLGMSKGQIN